MLWRIQSWPGFLIKHQLGTYMIVHSFFLPNTCYADIIQAVFDRIEAQNLPVSDVEK